MKQQCHVWTCFYSMFWDPLVTLFLCCGLYPSLPLCGAHLESHRGVSCPGAWVMLVFRLRKLTFAKNYWSSTCLVAVTSRELNRE